MRINEAQELKEGISQFDLVLAGDKMILEAAEVTDRKYLQETEGQVFLKMFLRYLHKNHKRVYLLVGSEEEDSSSMIIFRRITAGFRLQVLRRFLQKTGRMICW